MFVITSYRAVFARSSIIWTPLKLVTTMCTGFLGRHGSASFLYTSYNKWRVKTSINPKDAKHSLKRLAAVAPLFATDDTE